MRWCEVVFRGQDGELHTYLVNAASKFDAAAQGIQEVAKLWWYDPAQPLVVRPLAPAAEYRVSVDEVRAWEKRTKNGSNRPGGTISGILYAKNCSTVISRFRILAKDAEPTLRRRADP